MCGEVGAFLVNLGIKYNMFAFSFVLQFVVFFVPEVVFLFGLYKLLLNNKGMLFPLLIHSSEMSVISLNKMKISFTEA